MLSAILNYQIKKDDAFFNTKSQNKYILPKYHHKTHFLELTKSEYYHALIILRHYLKLATDEYWGGKLGAKNVDLFMMTPSISSPMGPGSDSEAISMKFGKFNTNLVDSSQFGFEPLLFNSLNKVYCYLPSMRGETPDKRHLNQFFHCEAEIRGTIDDLIPYIEEYIKFLSQTLLEMTNILDRISLDSSQTKLSLIKIISTNKFPEVSFDDAIKALVDSGNNDFINYTPYGRDITALGELQLATIFGFSTPFWVRNYDRDRVPFYQKPSSSNQDKVLNGDLIFPPILDTSFGGEVVGCGQRQDSSEQIRESLKRQKIKATPYEWYIHLRDLPDYRVTSGFGLGIERFLAWGLCQDDIKNVILYPRLKNLQTCP
jgi:asparaginyl-tRNA synthetase